jgi:diaminopimelate decarboxylase
MDYFEYKSSKLFCEEVPLSELAVQFGTPLYVYSHATMERHFKAFDEAFSAVKHMICFAVKANSNLAVIRSFAQMGAGADVVSGGELFRCLEAGVSPKKIVFSGVGKTIPEIEYALRRKVSCINIESSPELKQVAQVAQALGVEAPISLRMNPDVDPKTHPYISTGLKKNKFGLPKEEVFALYQEAKSHPNLDPIGLDFHIGSQLTETSPFVDAMKVAVSTVKELRSQGIQIRHLDFGGGLGVRYRTETPPSPQEYASAILPVVKDLDLMLVIEPGRALIGNAGVLVSKVIYVKRTISKNFVIVDAAMNDLLRPSLYDAEHEIVPVMKQGRPTMKADIVGPICESGDFLALDRELDEPWEGDLLCVRTAGAYGFSMSSQYNSRPRPAEVLVKGSQVELVRARESFDDLIRGERIPDWLR